MNILRLFCYKIRSFGIRSLLAAVSFFLTAASHAAIPQDKLADLLDPECSAELYAPLPVEAEEVIPLQIPYTKKIVSELKEGIGYLEVFLGESLIATARGESVLKLVKFWGERHIETPEGKKISKTHDWYNLNQAEQDNAIESLSASVARQFHNRVVNAYNREQKKGKKPYSNEIIYKEFKKCTQRFDYFLNKDGDKKNKCMALGFLTAALLESQNVVRQNITKKKKELDKETVYYANNNQLSVYDLPINFADSPF